MPAAVGITSRAINNNRAKVGLTSTPPFLLNQPVWNLLHYNSIQEQQTDFNTRPGTLAAVTLTPVFPTQASGGLPGIWVMVQCDLTDPTSFSTHLALQFFPGTLYLNFVNQTFGITDLDTFAVPGFISAGQLKNTQAKLPDFQNLTAQSKSQSNPSGALSNFIVEIWYLFGYPDQRTANLDANIINGGALNAGGVIQTVTVFGGSTQPGVQQQGGVWLLARLPTILDGNGVPVLNPNMRVDGFLRLIYNFTTLTTIQTKFHNFKFLRIVDSTGFILFDGQATPGIPAISPIQAPQDPSAYTPQGVHFDGATGLVTASPLVTSNTGLISFSGWFNPDSSLSGSQWEFSQGNGSNRLFWDTSPPATWFHMMGTIDAAANTAVLLINGATASGNPQSAVGLFSSAPTNGTLLYIGTDNNGSFYKGDIADLAIWYDFSFITNGGIFQSTVAQCCVVTKTQGGVTTITPQNPALSLFGFNSQRQPFQQDPGTGTGANNILQIRRPNAFLSGPANQLMAHLATGQIVQGIPGFTTTAGALTNSATNPGTIIVVPT